MVATISETLRDNQIYSRFYELLLCTELDGILSTTGPFTVFAPTNDAFERLSDDQLDKLTDDDEYKDDVALYHIISGNYSENDIKSKATPPEITVRAKTAQGEHITIVLGNDCMHPNGSNVTLSDIFCKNGTIHAINRVLSPHSTANDEGNDPLFEIYKTDSDFQFRLIDRNGKIITVGRGYTDIETCRESVQRIKEIAAIADVIEEK